MKKLLFITLFGVLGLASFAGAQVNISTTLVRPTVELVWEVHSYTPPFYKGKALYPIGGEVTVMAYPPENLGNPSSLTYTWKKDSVVQGSLSGVGKRSYTFSGSQFGDSPLVVVEVSNGSESATGALKILPREPDILIYKNEPLQGILFNKILSGSISTNDKELVVEAYPLFFSTKNRTSPNISYDWTANSRKLVGAISGSVSVVTEEPTNVRLQLMLQNLNEILQRKSGGLTIVFEE